MEVKRILKATEDVSMNWMNENGQEARYVRRAQDKVSVYISSQSGCKKACRFCHLTQTGQTDDRNATSYEMREQALKVMGHYRKRIPEDGHAKRVNWNFMARGEPLSNIRLTSAIDLVFPSLHDVAAMSGLESRVNISTILPFEVYDSGVLSHMSKYDRHSIYYSLYNVDPQWRKRWIPKAMQVDHALDRLKKWQEKSGNQLVIHHPFIAGENDSVENVEQMLELIENKQIKARFNLVRYNPYSPAQGEESSEEIIQRNFDMIARAMPGSKIIPRVGFSAKASCGLFMESK